VDTRRILKHTLALTLTNPHACNVLSMQRFVWSPNNNQSSSRCYPMWYFTSLQRNYVSKRETQTCSWCPFIHIITYVCVLSYSSAVFIKGPNRPRFEGLCGLSEPLNFFEQIKKWWHTRNPRCKQGIEYYTRAWPACHRNRHDFQTSVSHMFKKVADLSICLGQPLTLVWKLACSYHKQVRHA
jgi:hypothetical protein